MKRTITLAAVAALFLSFAQVCQAQFLGQLSTAKSPGAGNSRAGGYFGVYEDAFAFFGQFRYGFANYLDGAVKLGYVSLSNGVDEGGLLIGGDIKYQILDAVLGDPIDLAIGGGTEFMTVEDFSIFSLGGNVVASHSFAMKNQRSVTPYGRFNMRMQRESVDLPSPAGTVSDTDLQVGLNVGTELELAPDWSIIGEFFIEDWIGFAFGFNYHF